MIPPLVLTCDACGRLFIVNPADIDDDILCDDCWTPPERGSVDGLAGQIFDLDALMAKMLRDIYGNKNL